MTNGSLLLLHWAPYLISVNSLLSHNYKVFPEVTSNSKSLVRGVGILSLRVICPCYIPRDIPVLALSLVSAHKSPQVWVGILSAPSKPSSVMGGPSSVPNSCWANGLGSLYLLELSLGEQEPKSPLLWDLWNPSRLPSFPLTKPQSIIIKTLFRELPEFKVSSHHLLLASPDPKQENIYLVSEAWSPCSWSFFFF